MTGIPKCCTFKDTICFKKANLQIFARVDSQEFRVTRRGMQRGSRVINQDLLLFPKMEEKKKSTWKLLPKCNDDDLRRGSLYLQGWWEAWIEQFF